MFAIVVYTLLWVLFGVLHTWLAGSSAKQLFEPSLGRHYRLTYNLVATLHTVAVLLIGLWLFRDYSNYDLPFAVDALRLLLLIAGMVVLIVSLKQYDLGSFAGLKQLGKHRQDNRQENRQEEQQDDMNDLAVEPLQTSGIHRFVRHPLYSALFLLLWGMVDSPFGLMTAVLASLYLVIGTYSEERKLLELYGVSYQVYRQHVPAFIPWRMLLPR